MNKTILAAICIFVIAGCSNKKLETQKMFDTVMQVHEKVMHADEQLTNNKMQLDTILKQGNPAIKDSVLLLSRQLTDADDAMNNWMHKFDPDFKGKNDDDKLNYVTSQKKQIVAIDLSINNAINASGKYLKKLKKK